jgi:DNA-binding GntR family transcriptional regulator
MQYSNRHVYRRCYISYNIMTKVDDSPETMQDKAYQEIKNLILQRALPVAEFLSQRMLAKRVNCTVIPVREAHSRIRPS